MSAEYAEMMASGEMALLLLFVIVGLALAAPRLVALALRYSPPALPLPDLRITLPPLPLLIALAFLLRLPKLAESLWFDETFTARIASLPLADVPAAVLADVHPPLPYLIQWLAGKVFGLHEVALRLPALVAGVALVAVAYRLALALWQCEQTARMAALLTAVLPSFIHYSAEARQYSLLPVVVLLAMLALVEDRRRLFVVTVALLPLIHNLGYVYALVFGLLAVWRWRTLLPSALAAVPGALWLPSMLYQARDVADGFWISPFNAGQGIQALYGVVGAIDTWAIVPSYAFVAALTMLSLLGMRQWITRAGAPVLAIALGVPAIVALVSIFWQSIYLHRALLPAMLLLVLVWARWLVAAKSGWRFAALTALPVITVIMLAGFYPSQKIPLRDYIATGCANTDSVLVTSTSAAFITSYYLPDAPLALGTAPNDLNQTINDLGAFGFSTDASVLTGVVCVVHMETPLSSDASRAIYEAAVSSPGTDNINFYANAHFQIQFVRIDHETVTLSALQDGL